MPLTEQQARRRVRRLRALYVQIGWFVFVNLLLLTVNLLTSPENLWFYWVTVFWALGIVLQWVHIYFRKDFLGQEWEDKQVAKLTGRSK